MWMIFPCNALFFLLNFLSAFNKGLLTLSLFMALVLRADYHYFSVSFNYLAFVAHRFY